MVTLKHIPRFALAAAVLYIIIGSHMAIAQEPVEESMDNELQQRIDFSSAQILGQSIKSGAVYLMHRKQSDIRCMLKVRENYRKEIMEEFSLENSALTTGLISVTDAAIHPDDLKPGVSKDPSLSRQNMPRLPEGKKTAQRMDETPNLRTKK